MLSEKIQTLRCEKGWSQEELASRLSVVRQTVSKWEKGLSVPDSDMLVRLAEEFGTTVAQLIGEETDAPTVVRKKGNVAGIVLIILGFPVWVPVVVAIAAVCLSLYVSLWAVIVSLWAVFASFIGSAVGGVVGGIGVSVYGNVLSGLALVGAGLVCAGLSIVLFFGCKAATIGTVILTKRLGLWILNFFAKKEEA